MLAGWRIGGDDTSALCDSSGDGGFGIEYVERAVLQHYWFTLKASPCPLEDMCDAV